MEIKVYGRLWMSTLCNNLSMKKIFFPIVATLLLVTSSCSNDAKIRELMDEGKYEEAEAYAAKNDCKNVFQDVFSDYLAKLLREDNYDYVFSVLNAWTFETLFYEKSDYKWADKDLPNTTDYILSNGAYNAEAQKFNDIVDVVLKTAISKHDMVNARKCLIMYVPYSEKIDGSELVYWMTQSYTHALVNKARNFATNRIMLIEQIGSLQDAFNAIQFAQGSANLSSSAKKVLNDLGTVLKNNGDIVLNIVGHTSAEGDESTNQRLSEQRAKATMDYLISTGVESSRLQYEGLGSSQLKDANNPSSPINRRTEFIVL